MKQKRKPDFIIEQNGKPYLLRWWIIPRNRWFNIYLHKFLQSDDDRAMHDHPWASCSIILKGGYFEHTPKKLYYRSAGSIVFRRASAAHRVELAQRVYMENFGDNMHRIAVAPKSAWTIFVTGPKIREWGFHCPKGWTHWRTFYGVPQDEAKGNESGKGCI